MDARTVLALWADDLDLDLTHGNAAELFDLFKKHGFTIIHDSENHGPTLERAAGADDAETKMAVAALVALAERGIPTDVQELLVRGDPMRGIAPGALSASFAAAIRAMGEKK